jgi:hypothetical protein
MCTAAQRLISLEEELRMAQFSLLDAAMASRPVLEDVRTAALAAGFVLQPSETIPDKVSAPFPGGLLYAGTIDYLGVGRETLLFIRDAGEIVLAMGIPHPAMGQPRKAAIEAVRQTFGVALEDIEPIDLDGLTAICDKAWLFAKLIRGEQIS